MTQSAITLRNLRKTYAGFKNNAPKTALHGIDLDIPAGSIFGLLGPNGAGKSTMINIMAGLVTKSSGTVNIWGFDQDQDPRNARGAIGVMPQELNLDPFSTPRASLETQAGLYGIPKSARTTDHILDLIGLADKADAYPRSLSGGMRRRLLLGKALVHAPHILVLDEPTAGVDIELRQMLWRNIHTLNAQGTTVILTTHYLEEAQDMCDQIAIIDQGKLRALDTTANLLGRLGRKSLVIEASAPKDIKLPKGVTQKTNDSGKMVFSYNRNMTSPNEILAALQSAQVDITDIKTEEADLEDVFLELTKAP